MNRSLTLLAILLPSLAGCSGDGPPEFYRSALQARSEFVDSLSRIVDEKSAVDVFKPNEALYNERFERIEAAFSIYKRTSDPLFNKVKKPNFEVSSLSAEDRDMLVGGVKAQVDFGRAIRATEIRRARELKRIHSLAELTMLEKARTALSANQPFHGDIAMHSPNLYYVYEGSQKSSKKPLDLSIVVLGMTKEQMLKIVTADEFEVLAAKDRPPDQQQDDAILKAPPLPPLPQWAVDVREHLRRMPK